MPRPTTARRVQQALVRRSRRFLKYLRQIQRGYDGPTHPIFVVGCQRSGTNMLLQVLDRSLETWIYDDNHPAAFVNYRLKEHADLRNLINQGHCRWVVFKPLTESQHTADLLARYPQGRALWLFRSYQDTTNSAVNRWGTGQLKLIQNLATRPQWAHWISEKMPAHRLEMVRDCYHADMSVHSAAALKWYLRNALYFDQNLDRRPGQVTLLRYEDLVTNPQKTFSTLFTDLNLHFAPQFAAGVFSSSIGKQPFPDIDPPVRELCENMLAQLESAYTKHYSPQFPTARKDAIVSGAMPPQRP